MDVTNIVSKLIANVDAFGTNYVTQSYKSLSGLLTGSSTGIDIISLLLILYVTFWGVSLWAGTAKGSVVEMTYRLFRVFVIYTLATKWGDFQTYVYASVQALPTAISEGLLSSVNGQAGGSAFGNVTDVYNSLDTVLQTAINTYTAFIHAGGIMNVGPWLAGTLLVIPIFILVAYAAFLIILAKLFIWLMMALAPIFIVLLLFNVTSSYFNGWIKVTVNFLIVQILIYATVAFYISITRVFFDRLVTNASTSTVDWGQVAGGSVIGIIGIFLVSQIMQVASNISGAIGLGAPTLGKFLAGNAAAAFLAGRAGIATANQVGTRVTQGGNAATWLSNRMGYYTPAQSFRDRAQTAVTNFAQNNQGAARATRENYLNSSSYKNFVTRNNGRYNIPAE